MATIKERAADLGDMINCINGTLNANTNPTNFPMGFGGGMSNIDIDGNSIPMTMLEAEPLFEMNYDDTKESCIKKAFDQLSVLVKGIVPIALQDSKIILEKVKQDADQLGILYYEYEKGDKIERALMDSIRRGETTNKMFDSYTKLNAQMTALSDQITTLQNQMRKYYIDTYMDLQQKEDVDVHYGLPKREDNASLPSPEEENEETSNVIVGTENLIKMMAEKKKKAIMAKYNEVKDAEEKKQN